MGERSGSPRQSASPLMTGFCEVAARVAQCGIHSGLDRLCYKNGPFVSSGLLREPVRLSKRGEYSKGLLCKSARSSACGGLEQETAYLFVQQRKLGCRQRLYSSRPQTGKSINEGPGPLHQEHTLLPR